jgi:prepilin-type N-terminal cleavage/methylation domain-containing protein
MTALNKDPARMTRPSARSVVFPPSDRYLRAGRRGFTLIELLIVVVIISILAAIAIPKFTSAKEKAYMSHLRTDLRNLATAQEAYSTDNAVYYAGAVPSPALVYNPSPGVTITITVANATGWGAVSAYPSQTTRTCALFTGAVAAPAPATVQGVIACTP